MRVILVALLIMGVNPGGRNATAGPPDSIHAEQDTGVSFLGQPRLDLLFAPAVPRATPGSLFHFDVHYDLLARPDFGPKLVELSRSEQVVNSADRGANYGLMLGYLGNLAGLWGEGTALAIMGAGAALGTAWGVTIGSDDSSVRYRLEWENERPDGID